MFGQEDGAGSFLHVRSGTDGSHLSRNDVLLSIHQSPPPLIDRVVVSQIQMREAVPLECVEPFGFASEDEALEDGFADFGGRTLQIPHHQLSLLKEGVDAVGEEMIHTMKVDFSPHTTIQQNVASKQNAECVGTLCRHTQHRQV